MRRLSIPGFTPPPPPVSTSEPRPRCVTTSTASTSCRSCASPACQLFEALANDTWKRLEAGWALGVSQGEESITDHLLLEIACRQLPNVKVAKLNKREESFAGADWEWWIQDPQGKWYALAVHAKCIGKDGKYRQLRHKCEMGDIKITQADLLAAYATSRKLIPLYCFYNCVAQVSPTQWHCGEPLAGREYMQLGCSISPLRVVQCALAQRGVPSFSQIHGASGDVVPWRCIPCCDQQIAHKLAGHVPHAHDALPVYVQQMIRGDRVTDDNPSLRLRTLLGGLIPEAYRDRVVLPHRVLVVDAGKVRA